MNIQDIIAELDAPGSFYLRESTIKTIKEALWAGQAIRDSLGVAKYVTKDGTKTYRQVEVGDNRLAVESIEAWDAATRGCMSKNYYVVSESELLKVVSAAIEYGYAISGSYEMLNTAQAACRARPVESVCAGTKDEIWVPVKEDV